MGESETLEKVIERAKQYAKREAIEKAGVYIRSRSEVRNLELVKDEIISMAGGIVKVIDSDKEIISKDNAVKVFVTVTITIDTDDLQREIDKYFEKNTQKTKIEVVQEKIENKTPETDDVALSKKKVDEAVKLCDKGNFQDALPVCNEAITLNPENSNAYEVLGWIYNSMGNPNKAISASNRALQLNPKNVAACVNLAHAYIGLQEYNLAMNYCNKALKVQPDWFWTYGARGIIYDKLKNYDKAVEDFSKVIDNHSNIIEKSPNSSWIYVSRGWAYYNLNDFDKSMTDFKKAMKINPNNIWAYDGLGCLYYNRLGEYDKAIEILSAALSIDSNNPNILEKLGATYMQLKEYKKAISYFGKSIEINPHDRNYFWAYVNRGHCYKALGENKKAEADFTKARQLGWDG